MSHLTENVFPRAGRPPNTPEQLFSDLGLSPYATHAERRAAVKRWLSDGGQPSDWLRHELEFRGLLLS